MATLQIVNEHQLDDWVSKNDREAQTLIVELVSKLTSISCPNASHQHFPLQINQSGSDGEIITDFGYKSFIPDGRSFWEIGTGGKAGEKATKDYRELTNSVPDNIRKESSFIFVTPRSSSSEWPNTWKEEGISKWLETRKEKNEWRELKVINGAILMNWLSYFPALGQWFASKVLNIHSDFETGFSRWEFLKTYGEPPQLCHNLFTTKREIVIQKLNNLVIRQESSQLRIDTRYPNQIADFVAAYLQTIDKDDRSKYEPRVLIFTSEQAWRKACSLSERHVFVADFDIDTNRGSQLLQIATSSGHAVISSGILGGPPHRNSCELHPLRVYEMKDALIKSGYSEQRAKTLTDHSGRDLNALLRLIQGLSEHPDWATHTEASDLAIAQFMGQWEDENTGDQEIIEEFSGKAYREWIIQIRKAAGAQAAPVEFGIGHWKFTSRYEPWTYLGPLIGPEILDNFKIVAIKVLSEIDPRLKIPEDQYSTWSMQNRKYSEQLRKGIAETLALLGAQGRALNSCRSGFPQNVATFVIRDLLCEADSDRWASLNDVLPLLAEAAPDEFLKAVENASEKTEEPFSAVFSKEDGDFFGCNYMTGLLWALESLAWNESYLVRVCHILASIASVDPGGRWANRPQNSLVNILLPWLPQTVASTERRHSAVRLISQRHPETAWPLLINLLPVHQSASSFTHRPKWRDYIPEDWKDEVTDSQRWEDEGFYADLALELAGNNIDKLGELLPFYFCIHKDFSKFTEDLKNKILSEEIVNLPDVQRLELWMRITTKLGNHLKYADSNAWAVPAELLEDLQAVANRLKPNKPEIQFLSIFAGCDADHYNERGNFEKQRDQLLKRRIKALQEIRQLGGIDGLREFWRTVESPAEVGNACGEDETLANDLEYLPSFLESHNKSDLRFATSYVWRRFYIKDWNWVDGLNKSDWSIDAKAEFFAVLPLIKNTWLRAEAELGSNRAEYWKRTRVHPYREQFDEFEHAIAQLVENGRSDAAIQCFHFGKLWTHSYLELALQCLEAFDPEQNHIDTYSIQEIFNHLHKLHEIDEERIAAMEIKFLPLLNGSNGAQPRVLNRQLAKHPNFFCEIIRAIYRPKDSPNPKDNYNPNEDEASGTATETAYQLLRDWKNPPGRKRDGTFESDALHTWTTEVKKKCIESGHWEVASLHIGEVLYYAPRNQNGLWVDPVCELLDSKDDIEYRRGLRIKIFNSRGAYWCSGGKDEIELAEKWETVATLAEAKGFIRLATMLGSLAERYRKEAKRAVERYRHED